MVGSILTLLAIGVAAGAGTHRNRLSSTVASSRRPSARFTNRGRRTEKLLFAQSIREGR